MGTLQARDALEILGLRFDATPQEIKDIYRDLVKVWHPDRFGSDERLRRKAEAKLKQINDAYRVLRTTGGVVGGYSAAASVGSATPRPKAARVSEKRRSSVWRAWAGPVFFYGSVGLLLISLGAYAFFHPSSTPTLPPQVPIEQPTESARTTGVSPQRPGAKSLRVVPSYPPLDQVNTAPFQIRALSEADTAQIEAACSRKRHGRDLTAYSACARAELGRIGKVPGSADRTRLTTQERDAIETACSTERIQHDDAGYDRCVAWQMSELEKESARPDFSGVSETDRSSIEGACGSAKSDGPAAYDRCMTRMVKLLTKSR